MTQLYRVLVVDDDTLLRSTLVDILVDAGYETYAAESGESALTFLAENPEVDVVLSDVKMPGMGGTALLHEIRQHYPEIVVIMLTSNADVQTAVSAMREGALNYLLKPATPRQLLENVEEAIHRRLAHQNNRHLMEQLYTSLHTPNKRPISTVDDRFLRIGELMIDRHRLIALYEGNPLELTPSEYEILHALMQANGRVVTFEDIAFALQGSRVERGEARVMLSTHLSNLRLKMTRAGCGEYLANKRGTGYYIKSES